MVMKRVPELVSEDICCGVEMEYEGVSHMDSASALKKFPRISDGVYLSFKRDGSLRPRDQNTEVVFNNPLSGNSVRSALDQLAFLVSKLPYQLSWRCGMHVHVDYRGASSSDIVTTAVLAALMEDTFFAWDGTGRQENKFCSPMSSSMSAYMPSHGKGTFTKYAACNLRSMSDRGSLELRFASSTTDINRVLDYVNIGMATKQVARKFADPVALIESFLANASPAEWMEEHYHPLIAKQLAVAVEKIGNALSPRSMSAALSLAQFDKNQLQQVV